MENITTTMPVEAAENQNPQTAETVDLTTKTAVELVAMLNAEPDMNKHKPILDQLDETLKEENKQSKKSDISAFVSLYERNPDEFWTTFIESPYATIYKLAEDDEAEERYSLKPVNYRLIFSTLDECYGKKHKGQSMAQNVKYAGWIARFTDNLYVKLCSDRSSGVADGAKVKAVKGKFADSNINTVEVAFHNGTTKKVNFSLTGNDALKEQMQAIADAIMPAGVSVLIRKADLSVVMDGMRKVNPETGKTTAGREALCEKLIFTAVRKIKHGSAYEVESKAKIHNAKPEKPAEPTEKQEEIESKAPDRAQVGAPEKSEQKPA